MFLNLQIMLPKYSGNIYTQHTIPAGPRNCSALQFAANYSPFTFSFKSTVVLFVFSEYYFPTSISFLASDFISTIMTQKWQSYNCNCYLNMTQLDSKLQIKIWISWYPAGLGKKFQSQRQSLKSLYKSVSWTAFQNDLRVIKLEPQHVFFK